MRAFALGFLFVLASAGTAVAAENAADKAAGFTPKFFPSCYRHVAKLEAAGPAAKGPAAAQLMAETEHFRQAIKSAETAQACYQAALDDTKTAKRIGRPAPFIAERVAEVKTGLANTATAFSAAEDRFSDRSMRLNSQLASQIAPAAGGPGSEEAQTSIDARTAMMEAHEALGRGNQVHQRQIQLERQIRQVR